ncbi:homocysteine S-methyltransferase [Herbidospora cretacea]|uniref:homocysteine S-methyltransferase n=1 Tax=Herbidospora cretacea TaxID=28444 RepID=UPI000559017B|nr:homocysteine S-methyltransferase [Herbidospora cretacea]
MILDGGLATHLETLGRDLSDDLWSARLLSDDPGVIRRAHLDFYAAGADVATTASYQATIEGFTRHGASVAEAEALIVSSVELARQARDEHGAGLVAASVGPYGAYLADGQEYTGEYGGLTEDELYAWHRDRFHLLAGAGADLVAAETIPSLPEARALLRLFHETGADGWISFSCRDDHTISDGTPFAEAAASMDVPVGANCTNPAYIANLITLGARVVYPNSGETWNAQERTWEGVGNDFPVADWAGATHVGGCCRTTPEQITKIRQRLGFT